MICCSRRRPSFGQVATNRTTPLPRLARTMRFGQMLVGAAWMILLAGAASVPVAHLAAGALSPGVGRLFAGKIFSSTE